MRVDNSGATSPRNWRRRALAVVSLALLSALALTVLAGHLLAQTAHASGSISFAPAVSYPVGTNPNSVAIGDLNGDGHPDLVTANTGDNSVSVLLGNGSGGFAPAVTYSVGIQPVSVAIGDLNGHPDLVTADSGGGLSNGDVSVLLGNGDGTFAVAASYSAGTNPDSVAIGDLNGDGHPDLVTTSGNNDVSVLLNNPNAAGTFASAVTYPVGVTPDSVAIGDLNGDGHPDLVATNANSHTVSVLLNDTTAVGTFLPAVSYPVGETPESVAIGDLNGDGHPDLVTANSGNTDVSVLLNNPTAIGTFAPAVNYAVDYGPLAVAIGDFDDDGHPDLVTANNGNNDVSVLLDNSGGNGTFSAAVNYAVGTVPYSVAVGDLNGDGKPDVVTANSGSNDVSVLLNTTVTSSPTPTPTPGSGGGSNSPQVTLAITNGELSASTTAAPSLSATMNGQDQTVNYNLPITVTDSTGTGNGWNLTITSTQFSTSGAPVNTLPTTASTAISATSACASGTCTNPTNTIAYPLTIPAGVTAPTPVKLFNAATGTGLGIFTITPSVNILIPASALAGTYTSTLTLAIVSGP